MNDRLHSRDSGNSWQSNLSPWLLLGLYCALIYWLSDQPSYPTPIFFPGIDKVIHLSAYSLMALLAWQAFPEIGGNAWVRPATVALFCMLYGASDEWHQAFVPGRISDMYDWLADSLGALLAVGSILCWRAASINRVQAKTD